MCNPERVILELVLMWYDTKMTEQIHPKNTQEAKEQLRAQLALLSYVFEQTNLQYSVVGGLALESTVLPYRSNGTLRDLDVLSLGPDQQTATDIIQLFDHTRTVSDPSFPELGLESAYFSDTPVPYSAFSVLSGLRVSPTTDDVYLSYRGIERLVDRATLETRAHKINGVVFQRFPRLTILLRYILRGGVLKPKDESKVMKLLLEIMQDREGEPDLEHYQSYIEFIYEVREKYPHFIWAFRTFWALDQATGGKISGAKGKVYDMIGLFRS